MGRFSPAVFSVVTLAAACCAVVTGTALPASASQSAVGVWGPPQAVPGMAALSKSDYSVIDSLSCGAAGNCAAGGTYEDSSGRLQAFVVDQTGGSWGTAQEVPGSAALNAGGDASVNSVSCTSAGNCAAGGDYRDASGYYQGFVVDETGGSWGTAQEVPGLAALNVGDDAEVNSVSCASAGNCAAVGTYSTATDGQVEPFVVDETGGSWGTAQEISGTAAINAGPYAYAGWVTCPSAGNCVATGFVGYYAAFSVHQVNQGFVAEESGGSWGNAEPVPGLAPGSTPGGSSVGLSCWSAGNCLAAVSYTDSPGDSHLGLVDETDGSWGTPRQLPGLAALDAGGNAQPYSVSCGSAGNCAIGGSYTNSSGYAGAFVADESGGSWGTAQQLPGSAGLGAAAVISVSCGAAGTCAAGGTYTDSSLDMQAFVADESGGSWSSAHKLSGTAAADGTGGISVSCPPAGGCSAAGIFIPSPGRSQGFVVDEKPGTSTTLSLSAARVTYGREQAARVTVAVSAPSGATPAGTVTVRSGTAVVCASITLAAGGASCTLGATRLPAGTWHLTASYSGSPGLAASTSAAAPLTVARAASKVTLSLSAAKVTYGREQSERMTVTVTGQYSGTPTGKVTVKTGTTTVCTITLAAGKGSCVLTARQLPVGTHTLVAHYPANGAFADSTSARKTLKVVKQD